MKHHLCNRRLKKMTKLLRRLNLKLLRFLIVCHVLLMCSDRHCVSGKHPAKVKPNKGGKLGSLSTNAYPKHIWGEEGEVGDNQLAEEIYRTHQNDTVKAKPAARHNEEDDAVIEKLLDSLSSSDKCLKKVDSIVFGVNRLDMDVHESNNKIINLIEQAMAILKQEHLIERLNSALNKMEESHQAPRAEEIDGTPSNLDSILDNRLGILESKLSLVASNLEIIQGLLNQSKNQGLKTFVHSPLAGNATPGTDSAYLVSEIRRTLQEQRSKNCDCKQTVRAGSEQYPSDCYEIQNQGFNVTGIYKIKTEDMEPFYALCELGTADGGGWTVFQNRFDGSQDFYKSWWEYKHGFGNLAGEFWLGLDKIHSLTNQKLYELRVDMEADDGTDASATYSVFIIGPEFEGYRISTLGSFYGNAGDSLSYHAGQKFSTYDIDYDDWKDGSCSEEHGGAWWYKECDKSNLNGKYVLDENHLRRQSMYWITFRGPNSPLFKSKMMIRPLPASKPSSSEIVDQRRNANALNVVVANDKPSNKKHISLIRSALLRWHFTWPLVFAICYWSYLANYLIYNRAIHTWKSNKHLIDRMQGPFNVPKNRQSQNDLFS